MFSKFNEDMLRGARSSSRILIQCLSHTQKAAACRVRCLVMIPIESLRSWNGSRRRFHSRYCRNIPLLLCQVMQYFVVSSRVALSLTYVLQSCKLQTYSFFPFSIMFWLLLIKYSAYGISRYMDLWKICISSLCSIDELSLPPFSIISFLL